MDLILIVKAIIIGIVEGITEFLPISSTGHMIIAGHFIDFSGDFSKLFEIVIQLGAILAIVVLYWNKIWNSLKNLMPGKWGFKLWFNIIVAFIPSAVVGLLFNDYIHEHLFSVTTVACALVVGGIWMIYAENKHRNNYSTNNIDDVNTSQAFKIGCFQCLALWPGMSRSASTIIGAWIGGLSTVAAAEFSFFLAIPTMIAASGYSLLKTKAILSFSQIVALGVGFFVSFVVALIVVDKFLGYLKKKPMKVFAVYRIILGVLLLGLGVANLL
ncbi:undecaprenyl-diphosphate phosphatase [Haloimpatiens sp. FM7330]|uniref:undecaprenyl-diphosphate phosphatase n=1 Tax=Haloimpatiens sp. FM7330 TaxID=3298610 RepID=UPI00363218C2